MGWSDISISLSGPVVEDLRAHFVERWNFIYNEKYVVRKDVRYSRLTFTENSAGAMPLQAPFQQSSATAPYSLPSASSGPQVPQASGASQYPPTLSGPPGTTSYQAQSSNNQAQHAFGPHPSYPAGATQGQTPSYPPPPVGSRPTEYFPPPPPPRASDRSTSEVEQEQGGARGLSHYDSTSTSQHHHHRHLEDEAESLGGKVRGRFEEGRQYIQDQYLSGNEHYGRLHGNFQEAGISCQIVRSCTKWSHGIPTEHSVANAYISIIENSQHFVYIENQFFITATSDVQQPVRNKIAAAIVKRILRAARAGEKYKIIVIIPAVPGFAGDLRNDSSLGTRAIMKFQYDSINRGGHSIMEMVANAGYDPTQYIRFYNLRNYDRINVGASMREAEQRSGVSYEDARNAYDQAVELPAEMPNRKYAGRPTYQQYQQAADQLTKPQGIDPAQWDSVSECYMLGGKDIREVPWDNGGVYPEIDAFVSEELYIHTKVIRSL